MSRAQWNGTFRLHTPDPSLRAFGYCSCKQDTKERQWGQQFCQMERAILPCMPEAYHARFPDSETTHETKLPVAREKEPLVPRVGPFRSDRPKWPDVCTNRSFRNFGLNGKRPRDVLLHLALSAPKILETTLYFPLLLHTITLQLRRGIFQSVSRFLSDIVGSALVDVLLTFFSSIKIKSLQEWSLNLRTLCFFVRIGSANQRFFF